MTTFGTIRADDVVKTDSALSPDGRALTVTYESFAAEVGPATGPTAIRMWTAVVPLADAGPVAQAEFTLDIELALGDGTSGAVALTVNGQTAVADLTPDPSSEDRVLSLVFSGEGATECRVAVAVITRRDSGADATGFLAVQSLDAEILPRP